MSDYKNYSKIIRGNLPKGLRFSFFLHKRLIKPETPVLLHCSGCGRPICEVNSDTIEISNSFGVSQQSIKASDNWIRLKCHGCKAHISILWV